MLTTSASSGAFRRLFCDAAPCATIVQQTLDSVLRTENERFSSKWNLQLPNAKVKQSQDVTVPTCVELGTVKPKFQWKLVDANNVAFYTSPPRKLKAYRRLRTSTIRASKQTLSSPTNVNSIVSALESTSIAVPSATNLAASFKLDDQSVTPIKPSQSVDPQHRVITSSPIQFVFNPPSMVSYQSVRTFDQQFTLLRRHRQSERVMKRRSGTKMTDYFTISKRPRQSLK